VVITAATGDKRTLEELNIATKAAERGTTALQRLQQHLFADDTPPSGAEDESVALFSAPGEGREAVEIARRLLQEAGRGVPFDQMAVLLRAPQTYLSVLEHALDRAGVPAWFPSRHAASGPRGSRAPCAAGVCR
jgi:superfamily I DNA/RNA helicase